MLPGMLKQVSETFKFMEMLPETRDFFRKPAVRNAQYQPSPVGHDPLAFSKDVIGVKEVLKREVATDTVKLAVLKGKIGILVEVMNIMIAEAWIVLHLDTVHPQTSD